MTELQKILVETKTNDIILAMEENKLVGMVMTLTAGAANPSTIRAVIERIRKIDEIAVAARREAEKIWSDTTRPDDVGASAPSRRPIPEDLSEMMTHEFLRHMPR